MMQAKSPLRLRFFNVLLLIVSLVGRICHDISVAKDLRLSA